MASGTPEVNFERVIEAFNQSGYFPTKLDVKSAHFHKARITLDNVQWAQEKDSEPSHVKKVIVHAPGEVNTSVTALEENVPNCYLTICTGHVKGLAQLNANVTIKFGENKLEIDLCKTRNDITLRNYPSDKLNFVGSGQVQVESSTIVYQGSFTGVAKLTGSMNVRDINKKTHTIDIRFMAKKGIDLPQYFRFSENGLCWDVNGSMQVIQRSSRVMAS